MRRVARRRAPTAILFSFFLIYFFFSSEATAITSNLSNDKNNTTYTLDAVLLRISASDNRRKHGKRGREKRLKNNIRTELLFRRDNEIRVKISWNFIAKRRDCAKKFLGMRDKFNLGE